MNLSSVRMHESRMAVVEYSDPAQLVVRKRRSEMENTFDSPALNCILLDGSGITGRVWADCCSGNTRGLQRLPARMDEKNSC